ncbi:MAG: radical SAM family heme chaperone HemW [Clostridia bacterium]|nr:radical SAM family heme chaperone HemW [Clostridia bacterium]
MTGIYIHIPFCNAKCPYCDFYSFKAENQQKDSYLKAVLLCLSDFSDKITGPVDTVYFGGGTPSVFGGERIAEVISFIRDRFTLTADAEITVECNPSSVGEALVSHLKKAGVNRISMGMQSAVDKERQSLGRLSGTAETEKAISLFRQEGITNISLDLMLGIPHQTTESLRESLDFATKSGATHVSAYMLKIEEGTPFYGMTLPLPEEDEVCELYLETVRYLKEKGFLQYEISNFAKKGFESRHNLRYWKCEEYLGVGPSAHSFINGKRFYFPRDFDSFIKSPQPIYDGEGGDEEEYIMLRLRLSQGIDFALYKKRYNKTFPQNIIKKAEKFRKAGLLTVDSKGIRLNEEGFLLSNTIIAELTDF